MLNLLRNNFGLKVLAVCLALGAWGYFHLAAAPGTTARFDQTFYVPIVVTGLHPGYQAQYNEKTATVVVEAPRNGAPPKPDQVQAVLDLSGIDEPGPHYVQVKVAVGDLALKSISPGNVAVLIDRIEDHIVPVGIDYGGDQHKVVVESAEVSPPRATLHGTTAELAKVMGVRVHVDMPSAPSIHDDMMRASAVDAHGDDVSTVQISPNLVRVRVRYVSATTKTH